MADIFDEIDEDLKRDHMQLLWARYGKIVIALFCDRAACGLCQAIQLGKLVGLKRQAPIKALQSNDVVGALEAQLGQLSAGYKMLAQFQIAAEHAASGDFVAAEARYLN